MIIDIPQREIQNKKVSCLENFTWKHSSIWPHCTNEAKKRLIKAQNKHKAGAKTTSLKTKIGINSWHKFTMCLLDAQMFSLILTLMWLLLVHFLLCWDAKEFFCADTCGKFCLFYAHSWLLAFSFEVQYCHINNLDWKYLGQFSAGLAIKWGAEGQ